MKRNVSQQFFRVGEEAFVCFLDFSYHRPTTGLVRLKRAVSASKSCADFQSAVSPICNRQGLEFSEGAYVSRRLAECNSAIQQIENLRYNLADNSNTAVGCKT